MPVRERLKSRWDNIPLRDEPVYVWFGGRPYRLACVTSDGWCWIYHPDAEFNTATWEWEKKQYPDQEQTYVHETMLIEVKRNDGTYTPCE